MAPGAGAGPPEPAARRQRGPLARRQAALREALIAAQACWKTWLLSPCGDAERLPSSKVERTIVQVCESGGEGAGRATTCLRVHGTVVAAGLGYRVGARGARRWRFVRPSQRASGQQTEQRRDDGVVAILTEEDRVHHH